mmetsp:Transcript_27193/g.39414  ORF Transcript_27193/g.39414 Transcript_27193/m.39414 type:complete len:150 (+) Transcript_27193:236-685(+)
MQEWFAMHQEGNDTCCPKHHLLHPVQLSFTFVTLKAKTSKSTQKYMLPVASINIFWSSDITWTDWFGSFVNPKQWKRRLCVSLQVWVVSQKEKRQEQVQIHVGVDAYDAFCLLLRTPVLIVSYASTFSQAAALVAPDTSPHYRFQGRMD